MAIWLFWKCSCECVNVTAEYRNTLLIRIVRFSYSSCVNSFRLAFVGFLFFLWANSEANRKERKPVRRTWEQQFKLKLSCVCVCVRVVARAHCTRCFQLHRRTQCACASVDFVSGAHSPLRVIFSLSLSSFFFCSFSHFMSRYRRVSCECSVCRRTQNEHSTLAQYLDAVVMNGYKCHFKNSNLFLSSLNKLFNDVPMKVKILRWAHTSRVHLPFCFPLCLSRTHRHCKRFTLCYRESSYCLIPLCGRQSWFLQILWPHEQTHFQKPIEVHVLTKRKKNWVAQRCHWNTMCNEMHVVSAPNETLFTILFFFPLSECTSYPRRMLLLVGLKRRVLMLANSMATVAWM